MSRTLRDWLLMLQIESGEGLFRVMWTEDILAEVVANLRRRNPTMAGGHVTEIRRKITQTLESGQITDYEIDGTFQGTDVKDQHVHAAAVTARVDYLVTADQGFTAESIDLDLLPYEVHTPDSFLLLVDDSAPAVVRKVTSDQQRYWAQKSSYKPLSEALNDADCPEFAARVDAHVIGLCLNS